MRGSLIALLVLASGLAAQEVKYSVVLEGTVLSDKVIADAEISLAFDPYWGVTPKNFDALKQAGTKFPEVTLTGNGKSDNYGQFSFSVNVKAVGEGLPAMQTQRDGKEVTSHWVHALLEVKAAGFLTTRQRISVYETDKQPVGRIGLRKPSKVKGRILKLADRSALAKAAVYLEGAFPNVNCTQDEMGTRQGTTDADGRFEFFGDDIPRERFSLRIGDGKWTFASASKAWGQFYVGPGAELDLGELIAIGAASVSFNAIDRDSLKGVRVNCMLAPTTRDSSYFHTKESLDGRVVIGSIPPGKYKLDIRAANSEAYWSESFPNLVLEEGKEQAFGDILLDLRRSIRVLASDDKGGLERFTAGATFAGSVAPSSLVHDARRPYSARPQNLNAEKCELQGLFSGKWVISVWAEGYPAAFATVDIPADKEVKLKLERGGSISVSVKDAAGSEAGAFVAAIHKDSPLYGPCQSADYAGLRDLLFAKDLPGVYVSGDLAPNPNGLVFPLVRPGTYLIIALLRDEGAALRGETTVIAGKTADVALKLSYGKIVVRVLRGGKPATGAKIYLANLEGQADMQLSALSDAAGIAAFSELRDGLYYPCEEREKLLVEAARGPGTFWALVTQRAVRIRVGVDATIECELAPTDRSWCTLKTRQPAGMQLGGPTLERVSPNCVSGPLVYNAPRYDASSAGFGLVPLGDYVLSAAIFREGSREYRIFARQVKVTSAADTVWDLSIALCDVSGSVALPPKIGGTEVAVHLLPVEISFDNPRSQYEGNRMLCDVHGRFSFKGVPQGEYWLIARVDNGTRLPVIAARKKVTLSKEVSELALKFEAPAGNILLKVDGKSSATHLAAAPRLLVRIYDKSGTEVEIPDPWFARPEVNETTLVSIPPGVYTLALTGRGINALRIEKVEVKAGETTLVNASTTACTALRVTLSGAQDVTAGLIEARYEDSSGKDCAPIGPNRWTISPQGQHNPGPALTLVLNDIGPEVRQVRLIIPGFEDCVVAVNAQPSREQRITLKRK